METNYNFTEIFKLRDMLDNANINYIYQNRSYKNNKDRKKGSENYSMKLVMAKEGLIPKEFVVNKTDHQCERDGIK